MAAQKPQPKSLAKTIYGYSYVCVGNGNKRKLYRVGISVDDGNLFDVFDSPEIFGQAVEIFKEDVRNHKETLVKRPTILFLVTN